MCISIASLLSTQLTSSPPTPPPPPPPSPPPPLPQPSTSSFRQLVIRSRSFVHSAPVNCLHSHSRSILTKLTTRAFLGRYWIPNMDSANTEKTRDLESELVDHPSISSLHERHSLRAVNEKKFAKMSKIQHYIFALLLFCLFTVGVVSATLNKNVPPTPGPFQEQQRFQELLKSIDPSVLHEVLHENMKDKYQHGVFEKDKTAVEAIHQQDAEVAESLIELARRQATASGNGTVVTRTIVTSTDIVTSTPSPTTLTTPATSQSSSVTTTSQPSTSATVSSTPSSSPDSTVTQLSTSTAGTTTSTPGSSSESTSVSTTPSLSPTTRASSTSSPTGSSSGSETSSLISQTTIYTTTLANGAPKTVTAVTVVPAGQADQTSGGSGRPTGTGTGGSLQTGGSIRMEVGFGAILGAAGLMAVGAF